MNTDNSTEITTGFSEIINNIEISQLEINESWADITQILEAGSTVSERYKIMHLDILTGNVLDILDQQKLILKCLNKQLLKKV